MINVSICIPTRDSWKADFGQSLAMMMCAFMKLGAENFGDIGLHLKNSKCSLLPGQRTLMAQGSIDIGADDPARPSITHILFLDDDMRFPMDLLVRFLMHDVDIVAANCATKVLPSAPTARKNKEMVYTTETSTGLEEVDRIGCAVMLIKADVFRKIPQPWFAIPWDPNDQGEGVGGFVGEDVFFCRRAKEHGYKIYIDHDISKQVKHVGDFDYEHQIMSQWNSQLILPPYEKAA